MMRSVKRQHGMTLIELMISMVIGMFLVLGAVTVYTQGRQNFQINEGVARLQENMRFALDVLEPDIRLAGYWGMHNRGSAVIVNGATVTCSGANVTWWAINEAAGVPGLTAINNVVAGGGPPGCPVFGGALQPNTDILIVRHASGEERPMTNGRIQVQSSLSQSHLFSDGAMPADYTTFPAGETTTRDLVVNFWYVAQNSNAMDGIPSLRRLTLVDDELVDEEVIAGVESMQVQFGIDTDADGGDGNVDRYVDGDAVGGNLVLAVRLQLLMRSPEEERGYFAGSSDPDWQGYVLLDDDLAPIVPNDQFRRMMVTKTIFVRNFLREPVGS